MRPRLSITGALLAAAALATGCARPPLPLTPPPMPDGPLVVGYLAGWNVPERARIAGLPASHLTHITYAFGTVGRDGRAALADPCRDAGRCPAAPPGQPDRGNFEQLRLLKQAHPQLRVLISLGGWRGSRWFSDAARSERARRRLVQSTLDVFLRPFPDVFDGVDLDWEYPGGGGLENNTHRAEDGRNLTRLAREFRRQLDALGRERGRSYQLSLALGWAPAQLARLELTELAQVADFIGLMSYDYHAGDSITRFNSPLRSGPDDPAPGRDIESTLRTLDAARLPAARLVLGIPFFAHGYGQVAPARDGLHQRGDPAAAREWRNLDYHALVARQPERHGFVRRWSAEAEVPWLYHQGTRVWISYDDPQSVLAKARFAASRGLGGIMFWELAGDDGTLVPAAAAAYRER